MPFARRQNHKIIGWFGLDQDLLVPPPLAIGWDTLD